jgi:hypothetical protein
MLRKFVLGILTSIVWLGWLVTPTYSEKNLLTRSVTFADLGYSTDETLQGIRVTRDYGVSWPDAWEVQPENTLTVRFSHSSALRENSSMALDWNGTRLGSVLLTPENAKEGTLKVTLPGVSIQRYNTLHLEFYMGIRDDFCSDPDNPAVWATVHSSSFFEFAYALKSPAPDLGKFPLPFVDGSPLMNNTVKFVLPGQPTQAELNAVALISAKLGQLAAWRPLQVDAISMEQNQTIGGNLIVVGSIGRLRMSDLQSLPFVTLKDGRPVFTDTEGLSIPPGSGVLWEQPSRADGTAVMLIVTGDSDAAVLTAARALASASASSRLAGQLGIVLQVPEPVSNNKNIGQTITLEELGYRDMTARGTREQKVNFILPLPMAWQIQSEATLDLHLAHSGLLDSTRSSLNVLLNDAPVASILLTPKNATDAHATFDLPARLFRMGENKLTIVANMQVDKDHKGYAECWYDYSREAWLAIYADSRLDLPGSSTGLFLSLGNYPRAFIGSANLSDLAMVVPRSSNITIARSIVWISSRLGRFADGETLALSVIDTQAADAMASPLVHQILIGRPSENGAIAKLRDVLPQPFKPGSDEPEPLATIAQVVSPRGSVGYIQSASDQAGQPRLIVTGTSDEGLLWAAEALSDPVLLGKLKGDLVILSGKGSMTTAEIRIKAVGSMVQPSNPPGSGVTAPRTPTWVLWLSAGLFLVTFIVLMVAAWQVTWQRRKARTNVDKQS